MDPLRDLSLFVEVARATSFSRAAAKLGMPASTVSRRVAELERSLGLPLFVRTTRRVRLTEAGALLFARGQALVDAADEARQQVRGLAANPEGLLRVSLEADVGPTLVAPAVAAFLRRYPTVTIELDLSPRRVDLLAEGVDLAIRLGTLPDSGLTVRRLALLRVGLFAAPGYLARAGTPAHPADLPAYARLHLLHQADRGEWRLCGDGGEAVVPSAGGLVTVNNMSMLRSLACLGVGIAVMDEIVAAEEVAAGRLQRVLPEWSLPPVPVSLLTPARLLPAKTRLFIDALHAHARDVSAA